MCFTGFNSWVNFWNAYLNYFSFASEMRLLKILLILPGHLPGLLNCTINGFLITKWLLTTTNLKPLFFKKSKLTINSKQFLIENDVVENASWAKLLGIQMDEQLNLNLHISNIWKSASKQPNALVRLKCFPGFEERKVLINSFILSNFNCCPLVQSVSSDSSMLKVENSQKQMLRFLNNNYNTLCTRNYLKS